MAARHQPQRLINSIHNGGRMISQLIRMLPVVLVSSSLAVACAVGNEQGVARPAALPSAAETAQALSTATGTSISRSTSSPMDGGQVAQVIRVIDGDTIEVAADGVYFAVRYIGINTPETVDPRRTVECFGPQASARNKELVDGRTVQLEKDVSETDRYGRRLRYVYVDGRLVNEILVAEGFAQVSTYPPDVKYVERFLDAERRARERGLGLWGTCRMDGSAPTEAIAPPPLGPPGEGAANVVVDPSCSQFDSPGDDNRTAAEEYVCLRNTGGDTANLTGWSFGDFDARHAYLFPPFTLAAGAAMRLRSGCGANTASDLYWCADGAVWNNGGDVVTLRDSAGNVLASYSYLSPP